MYAYTGGKTGGHIMPLLAMIQETSEDAIYIGQTDSLEERLCKEKNIEFIGTKKYSDRFRSMILGFFEVKKKLKGKKINALIASGGFVSFPACLYAIVKRIPIFLLEENIVIGNFNRVLYPFCKKMFLAYPIENQKKKMVVTGLPLRKKGWDSANMEYDILIIGGSLGSKVLCDLANKVSKDFKTVLIAGRYSKEYSSNANLKVIDFSDNIYSLMKKSKIIIARAGASTTAEIFYINRPFLCIPSMKTKKNHQFYNAKYFDEQGACILCLEQDMDSMALKHIQNLIGNESIRMNMSSAQKKLVKLDAIELIYKEIKECIS